MMDDIDLHSDKTYLNNIDEVIFKDSVQNPILPPTLEPTIMPETLSTKDHFKPSNVLKAVETQDHNLQKADDMEVKPQSFSNPLNRPQKEAKDIQMTEDKDQISKEKQWDRNKDKDEDQHQIKSSEVIEDKAQNTKVGFIFPKREASMDFLDDLSTQSEESLPEKRQNEMPTQEENLAQTEYQIQEENQIQAEQEMIEDIEQIPDRLAFKIGEVAFLTGVKSYILRYWESEFDALRPKKANNNRRIYTQKDVKTILLIKKLLYKDKYSIEGAKKVLKLRQSKLKNQQKASFSSASDRQQQKEAMAQIKELIIMVSDLKKDMD